MALPVRLSWMNSTFTAEGCEDLPAHIQPTENGRLITSAWQLSPEEHAAVAATGLVCVQFLGGQPPVSVMAPQIEQPEGAGFRVSWSTPADAGGQPREEELTVDKFSEALMLVLNAAMKGAHTMTISTT